ncbi:glycosyltransferase family A protein [Streptomyces sp. NPDC048606]|uniref:glycosyltransferase family 2 protein n=1 Tax=Streptomyces sp. NPDC048606 TaxID=3154726 RepID=UPI0034453944
MAGWRPTEGRGPAPREDRSGAGTPVFVMPYYGDGPDAPDHLHQAVESLRAQTDPAWRLVLVDDASPRPGGRDAVGEVREADPARITVLRQPTNRGQGHGRNEGVRWAAGRGAPFVLFLDADDIAHPRRLERTRRTFADRPEVDFLYSSFTVVDERGDGVAPDRLTPSVREILDSHARAPEGPDAWIRIGVETGYTSLTSTVSVRTALASAHPFPEVRGSEDAHTWLRMAAGGTCVAYEPDIPARYRIPQSADGSRDRGRIGVHAYYRRKAEVDTDGFRRALAIALRRGTITAHEAPELLAAFLRRLALTMEREGRPDLAAEILAAPEAASARTEGLRPAR